MWMTQKVTPRQPGVPGRILVLADVSGSISDEDFEAISQAIAEAVGNCPNATFFAWASNIVMPQLIEGRFPPLHELKFTHPRFASKTELGTGAGGGNDLAFALRSIAHLQPDHTIVLSDGIEDGPCKCQEALSVVDQMTGNVSAFCVTRLPIISFGWDGYGGPGFMAALARRGHGRLADVSSVQRLRIELRHDLHVVHQRYVHHHHLPPLHIHHRR